MAVGYDGLSVDEDVVDAFGILVGLEERSFVGEVREIEHDQVGVETFTDQASVAEPTLFEPGQPASTGEVVHAS